MSADEMYVATPPSLVRSERLTVVVDHAAAQPEAEPVAGVSSGLGPVFLVASSGGHLAQLLPLEAWWRDKERVWVTFDKSDSRSQLTDERVEWAYHPTTRNVKNL